MQIIKSILWTILFLLTHSAFSQSTIGDINLLQGKKGTQISYYSGENGNDAKYIKPRPFWQKVNPLRFSMGAAMFLYQNVISPQLSSGCQYEMVCSNFSKHAIEEYGWLKGVALSSDRLLRCNPININELPIIYRNEKGQVADDPKQYKLK